MVTAIRKVHKPNGPWVAEGGWEYNAVLIAALMALVDAGPGDISLDAVAGRDEWGPGWAIGGLVLGAAASSAAVALGARGAEPAQGEGQVAEATRDVDTAGDPVTTED